MLTETNVRGRIEDRITWLKYMVRECEALVPELEARGRRFEGFCWYPYLDSTDWCTLCREPNRRIDPQGIFVLDGTTFNRVGTELSDLYRRLATGEIGSAEIPAYRLETPVVMDRRVGKYLPLMEGWDWQDGAPSLPGWQGYPRGQDHSVEHAERDPQIGQQGLGPSRSRRDGSSTARLPGWPRAPR